MATAAVKNKPSAADLSAWIAFDWHECTQRCELKAMRYNGALRDHTYATKPKIVTKNGIVRKPKVSGEIVDAMLPLFGVCISLLKKEMERMRLENPSMYQYLISDQVDDLPIVTNRKQLIALCYCVKRAKKLEELTDTDWEYINQKKKSKLASMSRYVDRLLEVGFFTRKRNCNVHGEDCEGGRGNYRLHISKDWLVIHESLKSVQQSPLFVQRASEFFPDFEQLTPQNLNVSNVNKNVDNHVSDVDNSKTGQNSVQKSTTDNQLVSEDKKTKYDESTLNLKKNTYKKGGENVHSQIFHSSNDEIEFLDETEQKIINRPEPNQPDFHALYLEEEKNTPKPANELDRWVLKLTYTLLRNLYRHQYVDSKTKYKVFCNLKTLLMREADKDQSDTALDWSLYYRHINHWITQAREYVSMDGNWIYGPVAYTNIDRYAADQVLVLPSGDTKPVKKGDWVYPKGTLRYVLDVWATKEQDKRKKWIPETSRQYAEQLALNKIYQFVDQCREKMDSRGVHSFRQIEGFVLDCYKNIEHCLTREGMDEARIQQHLTNFINELSGL